MQNRKTQRNERIEKSKTDRWKRRNDIGSQNEERKKKESRKEDGQKELRMKNSKRQEWKKQERERRGYNSTFVYSSFQVVIGPVTFGVSEVLLESCLACFMYRGDTVNKCSCKEYVSWNYGLLKSSIRLLVPERKVEIQISKIRRRKQ